MLVMVSEQSLSTSMSGLILLSPNLTSHDMSSLISIVYAIPAEAANTGILYSVKAVRLLVIQPGGKSVHSLSLDWSCATSPILADLYAEIGKETIRDGSGS